MIKRSNRRPQILKKLAKIASNPRLTIATNAFVERWYSNSPGTGRRFARRFQIITYHRVSRETHRFFEPTPPDIFEQQIRFMSQCFQVLPLAELVDRSLRGDVPERAIAITFDDGYADNYDVAFPILKRYRLPATIFLATGVIGTGEVLWHDRIFDAFRFARNKRSCLNDSQLPKLILDTPETERASLAAVRRGVGALCGEARRRMIEEIEDRLQPDTPAEIKHPMLTWDQIREMNQHAIDFGSHSVTHPILSQISRAELVKELRDSMRQLLDQLHSPVAGLAYPNGQASDYNEEVKTLLKESGYRFAVTTEPGFNRAYEDPYSLKRELPWQEDIELFQLRLFLQRHGLVG